MLTITATSAGFYWLNNVNGNPAAPAYVQHSTSSTGNWYHRDQGSSNWISDSSYNNDDIIILNVTDEDQLANDDWDITHSGLSYYRIDPVTSQQVLIGTVAYGPLVSTVGDFFNSGRGDPNVPELYGQIGQDIQAYGNANGVRFIGSAVVDHLNLDASFARVTGDAVIDTYAGDDNVSSGSGNDTIRLGSGNDVGRGNRGIDTIHGDDGDDYITGGNDNDTLYGGAGNDQIEGDSGDDLIYGGDGDDRLNGSRYSVGHDEIHGEGGNDRIEGADGDDLIYGGDGNDQIYDSADQVEGGDDEVYGGAGDDLITVRGGADVVDAGADNDEVQIANTDDNVTIDGGTGNDLLEVILFSNRSPGVDFDLGRATGQLVMPDGGLVTISGFERYQFSGGNDTIRSTAATEEIRGGNGHDYFFASLGNDLYDGDGGRNGDVDTLDLSAFNTGVFSVVTGSFDGELWTGPNGTGQQLLTYLDFETLIGTNYDDVLSFGTYSQTLYGGAGNDTLDGGRDADTMNGGTGNDIFYVDNLNDVVQEAAGEGVFDQVYTSRTYILSGGVEVERLATTDATDNDDITLVGNEFGQQLLGNYGDNILAGGGGVDSFYGYFGNDIYVTDRAGELVFEAAGQGYDSIYTSASYAIAAGVSIERFVTTSQAGTAQINLTGNEIGQVMGGNAAGNVLYGGAGNDSLYGYNGNDILEGAQGNDSLFGGAGVDRFYFREALGAASGIDRIYDMNSSDNIVVDALAVSGLRSLNANEFRVGTAALDADDRIIYDNTSGVFWFDADGNGAGAAILFGVINGAPSGVDHTWFELT